MRLHQAYRGGFEGRPGWWLHTAYDEADIEELKAMIPASQRTWDEEKHRWWVADEAVDKAVKIAPGLEAHLKQGALF